MTLVRAIEAEDYEAWFALWEGYNAFYGRSGPTALAPEISNATWNRFFDVSEPVHALVAESGGRLVGLAHYLFHRSTTHREPICYMQDLFTAETARGGGVGRLLIESVYQKAAEAGVGRVYWQTHTSNLTARKLYDQVAAHHGFIVYRHDVA